MRTVSVDHYENFPVASLLCPPALRPPITAIYWYARTADDLADEGDAPVDRRLADLAAYRSELLSVAGGNEPSPRWRAVFMPLQAAIRRHGLPVPLLEALLSAFGQDLVKHRYADRADVLDYCNRSANPVGRLLLHLHGIDDKASLQQSDAICSALQLINFWQDLSVDTTRDRLYIPLSDCARADVSSTSIMNREDTPAVRALVSEMCSWSRSLMMSGAPLVHRLPGRSGWELRLVVQGGLRILSKIARHGFDSLSRRRSLGVLDGPGLLWRASTMRTPLHVTQSEPA